MNSLKTRSQGVYIVSYYTGYIIIGTALLMMIPLLTSLFMGEWNPVFDFVISISISVMIGYSLMTFGRSKHKNDGKKQVSFDIK